eukprot:TRINITY_DN13240_c0_g1_i1.p1 TRINITY_DN13240_c0_g1~~TRINITY_DN13240_c0_g1_i1.p1  ORF type:complete len:293 (-),score=25.08 TRINITY_DN13240_c0_g1_i1:54-932(-)
MPRVSTARWPAENRYAVYLPVLVPLLLLCLLGTTHVLAVVSGDCDFTDDSGHIVRIYVPTVSHSTRMGMEYWIWAIGVNITVVLFLVPCISIMWAVLTHPIDRAIELLPDANLPQSASRVLCCMRFLPVCAVALIAIAAVGLVGLAIVPLQKDVLEAAMRAKVLTELKQQSLIHLTFAAVFFVSSFLHEVIVFFWLGWTGSCACRRSVTLKGGALLLLMISAVIGSFLMSWCPKQICAPTPQAAILNSEGFSQRCHVLFVCVYMASYALDVGAFQKEYQASLRPLLAPRIAS